MKLDLASKTVRIETNDASLAGANASAEIKVSHKFLKVERAEKLNLIIEFVGAATQAIT